MKPNGAAERRFEQYKKECQKWIRYFGLYQWDVSFIRDKKSQDVDGRCVSTDDGSRIAMLVISDSCGIPVQELAFHETCELLMARVRAVATARSATAEEIDGAIHEVVGTLTNTMFRDVKPK